MQLKRENRFVQLMGKALIMIKWVKSGSQSFILKIYQCMILHNEINNISLFKNDPHYSIQYVTNIMEIFKCITEKSFTTIWLCERNFVA